MPDLKEPALAEAARFYDARLKGGVGPFGTNRSTVLGRLLPCLDSLVQRKMLIPGKSRFLDMGCGDGRVNVLCSYLTEISVGVELDDFTLDDSVPLRDELQAILDDQGLSRIPDNIHLFCGDSTSESIHRAIRAKVGLDLEDFDVFYTYLNSHEVFAELVAERGKPGSVYLVYGMNRVFPRYEGLKLIETVSPLEDVLAVYQKQTRRGRLIPA